MSKKKTKAPKDKKSFGDRARQIVGLQTQEPVVQHQEPNVQGQRIVESGRGPLAKIDDEIFRLRKERDALAVKEADEDQAERVAEQEVAAQKRHYWPEGDALPTHYAKRRPLPCPKCFRVLLNSLAQAVVCTSSGSVVERDDKGNQLRAQRIASFRCKACEHIWKLPVKEV